MPYVKCDRLEVFKFTRKLRYLCNSVTNHHKIWHDVADRAWSVTAVCQLGFLKLFFFQKPRSASSCQILWRSVILSQRYRSFSIRAFIIGIVV